MDCFNCMSIWVAAPFALFVSATPCSLVCVWLGFRAAPACWNGLAAPPLAHRRILDPMEEDKNVW